MLFGIVANPFTSCSAMQKRWMCLLASCDEMTIPWHTLLHLHYGPLRQQRMPATLAIPWGRSSTS